MAIFAKKHEAKKRGAKAGSGDAVVTAHLDAAKPGQQPGRPQTPQQPQNDRQQDDRQDQDMTPRPVVIQQSVTGDARDTQTSVVDASATQVAPTSPSDSVDVVLDEPAATDSTEIDPEVMDSDVIETFEGASEGSTFGVADAIRLMRSLPTDTNPELVVRVVRLTLGAVDVSVEDLVQEAARKEGVLRDGLRELRAQAAQLEEQLRAKRSEIAVQESDLRETATIRERLRQATNQGHRPPPTPADATRTPHPSKSSAWAAD